MTTEWSGRPLAVVTGASSGIGFALAREFAQHGYDLVVAAENPDIDTAAAALRRDGRSRVVPCQVDLATFAGVEECAGAVAGTGRPVEVLALNAGRGAGGPFVTNDLADDLEVVTLNVTGTVHLAKRLVPAMVARGRGRLLFTSSVAATAPGPFLATYSASKAFVQSFAQALREELRGTGVTVTALMPGATETPFFDRAGLRDTKLGTGEKDDPGLVAKQAVAALLAGEDHVVTGSWRHTAQVLAARVAPETVRAAQVRRQTEPGTG
ncbi:MAG TPA: SDR family NAD(P)-dependent oxidoreductase [Pilimelia sp.]|nr:SDR family NAD(P)-dependent oxidoreductase [Pilimelia sp.]